MGLICASGLFACSLKLNRNSAKDVQNLYGFVDLVCVVTEIGDVVLWDFLSFLIRFKHKKSGDSTSHKLFQEKPDHVLLR